MKEYQDKMFESNAISYEYQTYNQGIKDIGKFESNAISYEYQTCIFRC